MTDGSEEVSVQALRAARASYSRLVAYLAARSGDIAAAEDALGDAFRAALERWPDQGVPEKPEAWLLTSAHRRLIDESRHKIVQEQASTTIRLLTEEAAEHAEMTAEFPDERLKLLFISAHPAIDPASRTPLMLQAVLGLDAGRIASAFLVSPGAMSQRLVRAKVKIREARIAFEIPERRELPERLDAVLDAIYAAYGTGWEAAAGADPRRRGLADEAIWLARLAAHLLPDDPEAKGLLALMLYCEARRPARRSAGPGRSLRRGRRGVPAAARRWPTAPLAKVYDWSRTPRGSSECQLSPSKKLGRPSPTAQTCSASVPQMPATASGPCRWCHPCPSQCSRCSNKCPITRSRDRYRHP